MEYLFSGFTLLALLAQFSLSALVPAPAHALISVAELNARKAAKERKKTHHSRAPGPARFLVVLDPGHGGIDRGTSYDGNPPVSEKDLTLILARAVARMLRSRGIEVKLTRDGDYEMPLAARTALANRLKADVFLSIHLNSMPGTNKDLAEGAETYILNHETDSTSRRLAQLENEVITGPARSGPQQEDVALILKDMQLDANLPESERLACLIQSHVVSATPRLREKGIEVTSNRGVRQAMFFVLLGANMPSALVEAGFLSNPHDRAWLLSLNGQNAFALAVARSINLFRLQRNTPQARLTLSRCKVH